VHINCHAPIRFKAVHRENFRFTNNSPPPPLQIPQVTPRYFVNRYTHVSSNISRFPRLCSECSHLPKICIVHLPHNIAVEVMAVNRNCVLLNEVPKKKLGRQILDAESTEQFTLAIMCLSDVYDLKLQVQIQTKSSWKRLILYRSVNVFTARL
jgi:hypothetical protein